MEYLTSVTFSLNVMSARLIHGAAYGRILSFWKADNTILLYVQTLDLFITDGNLGDSVMWLLLLVL